MVDNNDYNILLDKAKLMPNISTTVIEKYNIKKQSYITIDKNEIIKIK